MRYKFEIWNGETMITESDYDFETEDEATEEGLTELDSRIEHWKSEGTWDEATESAEDYEVKTKENDDEEVFC